MATHVDTTLSDDPKVLRQLISQLQSRVNFLEEQFRLAQHKNFSATTEASPGQSELFNEAEQESELKTEDNKEDTVETEDISYTRNKPKRDKLPDTLPREEIILDIPEEEKTCSCCQGRLHQMGEERSEKLDYKPAELKIIETIRLKYGCRHCEKNNTQVNIVIAPVPPSPIPKSIATPSLLSQIIIHKYQFALPLYRQESVFQQQGIQLSRKTMSNWMLKCGELLKPVIERLKTHLILQNVIHADETTIKVINDDKQKSYMWLYCTGTDSPNEKGVKNIVLYDYHASRSGQCARDYLCDYRGYLQVDGYVGYEQTQAMLVGCMAHARRKFIEAQKANIKGKTGKADWAINHIQKLYRLEKQIAGLSPEEKYQHRQEKAQPLLEQFKQWLDTSLRQVAPQTLVGKAVRYTFNQWPKLVRYCEDGLLAIDNNRAERAIKPFVIGRKNWMFSNTANGAQASSILYSLIETAKANGLQPVEYLQHLLEKIPAMVLTEDNLDSLMPWNFEKL